MGVWFMDRLSTKEMNMTITKSFSIRKALYLGLKRTIDICAGLVGCLLLLPLMLIIKIANMINGDFGKIIYTQDRIGLNGKTFNPELLKSKQKPVRFKSKVQGN